MSKDLDALLTELEESKPHTDPCDCGDCKLINSAVQTIQQLKLDVEDAHLMCISIARYLDLTKPPNDVMLEGFTQNE